MFTISRGTLSIEIEQPSSRGYIRAVARCGEQVAVGSLANSGGLNINVPMTVWDRLEFFFYSDAQRWLAPLCDQRFWHIDDEYEEPEASIQARPVDSGWIILTSAETSALQAWIDKLSL
jgi:hypothetical protein